MLVEVDGVPVVVEPVLVEVVDELVVVVPVVVVVVVPVVVPDGVPPVWVAQWSSLTPPWFPWVTQSLPWSGCGSGLQSLPVAPWSHPSACSWWEPPPGGVVANATDAATTPSVSSITSAAARVSAVLRDPLMMVLFMCHAFFLLWPDTVSGWMMFGQSASGTRSAYRMSQSGQCRIPGLSVSAERNASVLHRARTHELVPLMVVVV